VFCGCYVNQRPLLQEEFRKLYSYDGYWVLRQELGGLPPIERRSELYRSDGRLNFWLNLVRRYGPPAGRVIEIGAAPGVVLQELKKLGYTCLGIEGDEKVAAWMRERTGAEVRVGFFPGLELPSCDLVLGFDVLEHTPAPLEFMREIARLLVPGGTAILQTPVECRNYENPFSSRRDFFDDVEHLFLFTDRSVRELARRAGLEVTALEEAPMALGSACVMRKP
jgi:SAM-dependent methyltransferase